VAIAAAILAVGIGGVLIGRSKPRASDAPPTPNPQRTVETPPVHIDEHLSAVAPADSAPPANPATAPSAAPAASAAPAVAAETEHGAPASEPAQPATEASTAKPANGEKPPKPHPATGTATETPHRPSSSHETPSSGYKPGGI
jgi:hypothetical protein